MKYYECHITMDPGESSEVHRPDGSFKSEVESLGWKHSKIDGDPVLGQKLLQYATKHFPERIPLEEVVEKMNGAAKSLQEEGIAVVRQKVELVLFDTKVKNVEAR